MASASRKRTKLHPKSHGRQQGEALARAKVAHAVASLRQRGVLAGKQSHKLSARVDPGLLQAARARLGQASDTEVVTAALAVLAGGDDFGAWLISQSGKLPQDFELAF